MTVTKRMKESRMFMELAFQEAMNLYKKQEKQKGDSWQDATFTFMNNKLDEEYYEYKNLRPYDEIENHAKELLDLIVVAAMLYEKIILEMEEKEDDIIKK